VNRARELIGYNPSTPFKIGLQNTIQWFRNHWQLIETSASFGPGVSAAVKEMTTVNK
jgi:UDP-glucose 4-epimerase